MNGTQYVDERVVLRDVAGGNKDHYYLHEELYSVAGMTGMNGALKKMYVYDTYGRATVWAWPIGDLNRSGTVNSFDMTKQQYFENISSPLGDVNEDGNLNSFDQTMIRAHYGDIPVALTYSALDNPFMKNELLISA